MRNITDHRTGKWDLYAVSTIYEVNFLKIFFRIFLNYSVMENLEEGLFGPKFLFQIFLYKTELVF